MKVCSKCGVEKPISAFSKNRCNSDGLSWWCKKCSSGYNREWYDKNKADVRAKSNQYYVDHKDEVLSREKRVRLSKQALVNSYKTPCVKCGESRLYVIDFHHKNPVEKSFAISYKTSKKALESEIQKCVCLCRNCHTEFHHLYGQNPDYPLESLEEYLRGEIEYV